jgi:murein DD-endopeptidase MepM/ murein hydrolase activator NlpD
MRPFSAYLSILIPASLVLSACGSPVTPAPTPSPLSTPSRLDLTSPTSTNLPTSTSTSTIEILPSSSSTPTATPITCDVLKSDFCVGDGIFILKRPIAPPGNDVIDRFYPYGSTEAGSREAHHGVEFENASGTPVLAAAPGTVFYAGNDSSRKFSPWANFYGNLVVLQHSPTNGQFNYLYTLYAHLSKLTVSTGQSVSVGEIIGAVGATGTAAGSHLHFELRLDPDDYFSTLNPELWLAPRSGNGTLVILAPDAVGATAFPSFKVQYFREKNLPLITFFTADGYAPETVNPLSPWNEVAAIGDQPAGWYRITSIWNFIHLERWVQIEPGMLTRVEFILK